jgi:minimal PKS chain-length factor (CLF/KS beta)
VTGRTLVTGLGVVAPTGLGAEEHWAQTLAGKNMIDRISRFDPTTYPVRVAGEVRVFDGPEKLPSRLAVQTDRWTHFALYATELALADASLDPATVNEYELAVITASSSGGTEFGQREIERLWSAGPEYVGVYQSIAWFYAASTGQISIRHGMRGACGVVCAEQAGGLDAMAASVRQLRAGARVVVTGGTDASLCPYGLTAQLTTGHLSPSDDPDRAYRPFDDTATGYVPGEGGAILVMESEESVAARGAGTVYGEFAGHAATFDAPPGRGREPGLRRAAEQALARAGVTPDDVDLVFADAAGRPGADRAETEAICALFGARGVPVTAPKTMTGRLYAGGAALDVATALLALRDQVAPPTIGVDRVDPGGPLDLVRSPRDLRLRTVLVLARGHGGFNSAAVLRAA